MQKKKTVRMCFKFLNKKLCYECTNLNASSSIICFHPMKRVCRMRELKIIIEIHRTQKATTAFIISSIVLEPWDEVD